MIYLFNTNIVPSEGVVRVSKITIETAREIANNGFISAIGHDATAKAFSAILGADVQTNRINANPQNGDKAISLKINGRLPEGQILTAEEMEQMGYTLYLIEFYDQAYTIHAYNTNGDGK